MEIYAEHENTARKQSKSFVQSVPTALKVLSIIGTAASIFALGVFSIFLSWKINPDSRKLVISIIGLVGFFVLAGVVTTAIFIVRHLRRRNRQRVLEAFGARDGWRLVPNPAIENFHNFESYALFRLSEKKIVNLIKKPFDNGEAFIFDYHYTISTTDVVKHCRETVFAFYTPHLQMPYWTLSAGLTGFFGTVLKVLGYQDINFSSHPKFSKLFHLRGGDESRIRELFHPSVLSFLETMPKISLDGGGHYLFVYTAEHLVAGENLGGHFRRATAIYNLFRREAAGASH